MVLSASKRCWFVISLVSLAWCCGGCGGGANDAPDLGTVTGTVTLDGKPLANVAVEFYPEEGRPSTGATGPDGKYVLQYTFDKLGAKIGKHVVRITSATATESESGETQTTDEKLPAKYHEKSELTADVKAGNNEFNFDLKSK